MYSVLNSFTFYENDGYQILLEHLAWCYWSTLQLMREYTSSDSSVWMIYYKLMKFVARLGVLFVKINCWTGGCMMYCKDIEYLDKSTFCDYLRFMQCASGRSHGHKWVPLKGMHYMLIILSLKCLFGSMCLHRICDGIMTIKKLMG